MNRTLAFVLVAVIMCTSLIGIITGILLSQDKSDYNPKGNNPIPTIHIKTKNKEAINFNESFVNGSVQVLDAGKYNTPKLTAKFKTRGSNALRFFKYTQEDYKELPETYEFFQKFSYNIRLGTKYDIFNLGTSLNWVLKSQSSDANALLRDTLALKLAKSMGVPQQIDSILCELYLNDKYAGVYTFHEQIEVAPNRVDAEYLMELDERATDNRIYVPVGIPRARYWLTNILGETSRGYSKSEKYTITVKSNWSNDAKDYLTNFMTEFNNILKREDDEYLDWIDLQSWVNYWLVEEIFMKNEIAFGNINFYKPYNEDKLYMTSVWDVGVGSGNLEYFFAFDYSPLASSAIFNYNNFWVDENGWVELLLKHDSFKNAFKNRFNEIRDNEIAQMLSSKDEYIKKLQIPAARDQAISGYPYAYIDFDEQIIPKTINYGTYEQSVDYLYEFLKRKVNWLDNYVNKW